MGGIIPSAVLVLQSPAILFVFSTLELRSSIERLCNLSMGMIPVAPLQQAARGQAEHCISAFCVLLMMLVKETEALMSAHQRDEIARTHFNLQQEKGREVHL